MKDWLTYIHFVIILQIDTIFRTSPTDGEIKIEDHGKTDYKYEVTKSTEDKLQLLDIHGELSASILCGLISVSGSGSYLKDTRKKINWHSPQCNHKTFIRQKIKSFFLFEEEEEENVTYGMFHKIYKFICIMQWNLFF